jgi:hypothetical protein
MSTPTVTPELKALLRRVKLRRCLDTLPNASPSQGPARSVTPSSRARPRRAK